MNYWNNNFFNLAAMPPIFQPPPVDPRISAIKNYKDDAIVALVASVAIAVLGLLLFALGCPIAATVFIIGGVLGGVIFRDAQKVFSNLLDNHQFPNLLDEFSAENKTNLIFKDTWLGKDFYPESVKRTILQLA